MAGHFDSASQRAPKHSTLKTMTYVYHYTTGHKLPLIEQSGVLLPTSVAISPQEKPVLWFSTNTVYEPTAIKLILQEGQPVRPTPGELHELVGLYRFSISARDSRLRPLNKLSRLANISSKEVSRMVASGLRIGAIPSQWYGVLSAIALSELTFESWTGEAWVPASLVEEVGRFRDSGPTVQSISAARIGVPAGY